LILAQSAPKCVWWFGSPQTHWRSYIPRQEMEEKERRGRCLSDVSDRDETITGWWGDKMLKLSAHGSMVVLVWFTFTV